MTNFLVLFIAINLINVIIQTLKSLFTIKGNKWTASLMNAITYFVYTYVIVFTASDGLSMFEKACIVGACNLIGVFFVKLLEEKMTKDKLWIYQATVKESNETIEKIHRLLKDMEIACVYNEIIPNQLYSMQVFSNNQRESILIKDLFENYRIKYNAIETKDQTPEPKKEKGKGKKSKTPQEF